MNVPLGDWQFWAVTALFALAVLWLARGVLPGRKKKRARRVRLTVGGRSMK